MEIKTHCKLFKAGKLWMTALVSVAIFGGAETAHADQTALADDNQQPTQQGIMTDANTIQQKSQVTLEEKSPSTQPVKPEQNKVSQPVTHSNQAQATRSTNPQATIDRAGSTIIVTNPTNYPTAAGRLVGHNQAGQPYYIYQVVNLNSGRKNDGTGRPFNINGRQGVMILAVDPVNPQGTAYVYITDDRYQRVFQSVIVRPGTYADISVDPRTGLPLTSPDESQVWRVSNTKPFSMDFNGQTIQLPASLSIKSYSNLRVSPVYGLGNQNNIAYMDKVDITPQNDGPAIEYIYRDSQGHYHQDSAFLPADVPVNGMTGQEFTIENINNYKLVLTGHYLTNQFGNIANTENKLDYHGTISQFQLGKYYQKTLYDWDRSVSQTLIYQLIDPDGKMNITLLLPDGTEETRQVAANEVKSFSNGTLARNPFVPGANSVQFVYADLGHIIPVDQNGHVISTNQPIYNNDLHDAHKAGATQSPDLTAEGWVLADPSQATITPSDPGADTLVQYVKVVESKYDVPVSQTVKYEYADGVTAGRPALPKDNVQTVTFTHTVITNPVTHEVIAHQWTPAQRFTAVATPAITGFYPDYQTISGNDHVTHETPSMEYVVKYSEPHQEVNQRQVTQTVVYKYADGITEERAALPSSNVQTLTFNHTVIRDPHNHEVISESWTPAQRFTHVDTPQIEGFLPDVVRAGSDQEVTHDSADTYYEVLYAAPVVSHDAKVISQIVHYKYADGETAGRPTLPKDNLQLVTFQQKIYTNPFTSEVDHEQWAPDHDHFAIVQTPTVDGFYANAAQAGSAEPVTHGDHDTYYEVEYKPATEEVVDTKAVTQTIEYQYADGVTVDRPQLPATDTQRLVFNRVVTRNPWTQEVISDQWSPAQRFSALATPAISGFFADQASAGSNAEVTHESDDTHYLVKYAEPVITTATKTVQQTIRYQYADGITAGRPALPQNNVQRLTFTETITRNPFTNQVIADTWTPAQTFSTVVTPDIDGFTADYAQIEGQLVSHDSADLNYVVTYVPTSEAPEQPQQPEASDKPGTGTVPSD